MDEKQFYNLILIITLAFAAGIFVSLFFVSAPYGRHTRRGWGASIPNWLGWLAMETPSPLMMMILFLVGDSPKTLTSLVFLLMWLSHYVHRAFIYPFEKRNNQRPMPALVMSLAILFNLNNGYLNGRYLFHFAGDKYPTSWLLDARFIIGATLFLAGFILNRWADRKLRGLRQPGETGYKIPFGGFYRFISCPNYLGEIVEWCGWALATWSLSGLAFAVWTIANLVPRAYTHHHWYRRSFPEYPPERKALIPGVW